MDPGLRWISFSYHLDFKCVFCSRYGTITGRYVHYFIYRTQLQNHFTNKETEASRHSVMVATARKRQSWDLNPGQLTPQLGLLLFENRGTSAWAEEEVAVIFPLRTSPVPCPHCLGTRPWSRPGKLSAGGLCLENRTSGTRQVCGSH